MDFANSVNNDRQTLLLVARSELALAVQAVEDHDVALADLIVVAVQRVLDTYEMISQLSGPVEAVSAAKPPYRVARTE